MQLQGLRRDLQWSHHALNLSHKFKRAKTPAGLMAVT